MGEFRLYIEGWLNMRSSFHPPQFWSGLAGSGGGTACISSGRHVAIIGKSMHVTLVMLLWTTRAEAEGEEEDGHYTITLASVFIRVVTLVSKRAKSMFVPIE